MLCFPSNDLKSNITFFLLRCFLSPALLTVTVVPHAASLLSMSENQNSRGIKKKKHLKCFDLKRISFASLYKNLSSTRT